MSLERVLLWISARGRGSWTQFRGAVEELYSGSDYESAAKKDDSERYTNSPGIPVYQQIRFALERLGHVEFFTEEGYAWRVVPPTLALLPGNKSGRWCPSWTWRPSVAREGVLCGARSPSLLHRLNSELEVNRLTASGMPDRIVIRGTSKAVGSVVARLDLFVQADAPMAILSAAPDVGDLAVRLPAHIPKTPGWTVHQFSSYGLRWIESTGVKALNTYTGLFRFVMGHRHIHYLRWRGRSYQVPVEIGKYAVMPKKKSGILIYDRSRRTLSLPAACRPPLLVERALILCSGRLPLYIPQSRRLEYAKVLPEPVGLIAQLLRQEVTS